MKMTSKNVAKALPLMALTGMGALVGVHAATGGSESGKVNISQETHSEAIPMALLKESTPKACAPGDKERVIRPGKPGVREIHTKVTTEGGKETSREKVSERIAVMPEAKTVQLCSNTVSRSEQRRSLSGIDRRVVQEILSTTELGQRPGAALTPAEVKKRQEAEMKQRKAAKEKERKKKAAAIPKASPSATPTKKVAPKKVELKKAAAPTATQRAQAITTTTTAKSSSPSPSASASTATPTAASTAPTPTTPPITGSKEDWMQQAGIDPKDYAAVDYILFHESGWNYKAVNASSGAYGLCQALPGSKMASAGADWATNPITQLKWCNEYAEGRYNGWAKAMEEWQIKHWW